MNADPISIERIEMAAMTDFYRAAPGRLQATLGIEARQVEGASCLVCRSFQPTLMFRRVLGLGVAVPSTLDAFDRVCGFMDRFGEPYSVHLSPHAQPAELSAWLERSGFARGYAWMKFVRPCSALDAHTDLELRAIGPVEGDAFGRVIIKGFGLDAALAPWIATLPGREKWICAMAFADGTPVGSGAAYVDGDYAWLGFAATLPEARRRGAQRALIALRLREAAARGATVATVETGERLPDKPSSSFRNILNAGFQETYLRANYLSPASGRDIKSI